MRYSIRMSGLGGQGMVTAANVLGSAAVKDGNYSIVIPFFGAEKRLAPTESYLRISDKPVDEKGEVTYPDVIMIYDETVISKGKSYTMPFYEGLQKDGLVIINSTDHELIPVEDRAELEKLNADIRYIPATQFAQEVAGTALATNMVLLGSLLGATEMVTLDSLEAAITDRFGGKGKFIASATTAALDDVLKRKYAKSKDLIDKNMTAIRAAYAAIKEGE